MEELLLSLGDMLPEAQGLGELLALKEAETLALGVLEGDRELQPDAEALELSEELREPAPD